jgi:hypothetical protein
LKRRVGFEERGARLLRNVVRLKVSRTARLGRSGLVEFAYLPVRVLERYRWQQVQ